MAGMFENTSVLVIGATGGIGSAAAGRFAQEGALLTLVARSPDRLRELADSLGGDALAIPADATRSAELERVVSAAEERWGRIDVMVHAVGSILLRSLHLTTEEQFRETLELNLVSPFLAMKAVIPGMLKRRSGRIVVCSSVAGSKGLVNHEAISAAKGGLEAMVRSAAMTYAKKGVRINGVAFGLIRTPLAAPIVSNESSLKVSLALHPMGRIGEPADATEAILYLASERSPWTTGVVLPIDGGMAAGQSL